MSKLIQRTLTVTLLLGICFFATTSVSLMAATNANGNGNGGSFEHWINTPGGGIISDGAIAGVPGLTVAFNKVYEAKCGVDPTTSCPDLCDGADQACVDWVSVYAKTCLCPSGS